MVYEGDPAMFRCWLPSNPNARLKWSRADGTPLPNSAFDDGTGTLYYLRAHVSDADFYVCSVITPNGIPSLESDPVELKVKPHERRMEVMKRNFPCSFFVFIFVFFFFFPTSLFSEII